MASTDRAPAPISIKQRHHHGDDEGDRGKGDERTENQGPGTEHLDEPDEIDHGARRGNPNRLNSRNRYAIRLVDARLPFEEFLFVNCTGGKLHGDYTGAFKAFGSRG